MKRFVMQFLQPPVTSFLFNKEFMQVKIFTYRRNYTTSNNAVPVAARMVLDRSDSGVLGSNPA
jgi:hypothetical protein